jgi:hypothetical protein
MFGNRAKTVVRIGVVVVLALILAGAGLAGRAQATAFGYSDLLAALRAHGAAVQESGKASTLTFQGTGHGVTVNGAAIEVHEYSAALAAQLDAARVSKDGATFSRGIWPLGGQAVTVDWIAPPHHYRKGRVIVTYVGRDTSVLDLLTSVLGPQFAGG